MRQLQPRWKKCPVCGRRILKFVRGICRHCAGEPTSATSRMWVRKRALVGAKRLRAKHGLTQNLLVPWYALERPKLFPLRHWVRMLERLQRYELVVWNALLKEIETTLG